MADMKDLKLNDEQLENVSGGTFDLRWRTELGVVIGPSSLGENNYRVKTDECGEVLAGYDAIHMVEPGMRVKVALVGMGKWQIVEFL